KEGRWFSPPPQSFDVFSATLEVEGDARVDIAAKSIPGARIGVTVTRTGRAATCTRRDQRRIIVEQVIHAQAEVVVVAEREGRSKIKVMLCLDLVRNERRSSAQRGVTAVELMLD